LERRWSNGYVGLKSTSRCGSHVGCGMIFQLRQRGCVALGVIARERLEMRFKVANTIFSAVGHRFAGTVPGGSYRSETALGSFSSHFKIPGAWLSC
jgi:hypothetical protein